MKIIPLSHPIKGRSPIYGRYYRFKSYLHISVSTTICTLMFKLTYKTNTNLIKMTN